MALNVQVRLSAGASVVLVDSLPIEAKGAVLIRILSRWYFVNRSGVRELSRTEIRRYQEEGPADAGVGVWKGLAVTDIGGTTDAPPGEVAAGPSGGVDGVGPGADVERGGPHSVDLAGGC